MFLDSVSQYGSITSLQKVPMKNVPGQCVPIWEYYKLTEGSNGDYSGTVSPVWEYTEPEIHADNASMDW